MEGQRSRMRDVSATVRRMEGTGPEAMRQAMADYVHALHQAYLDATATLPLPSGPDSPWLPPATSP